MEKDNEASPRPVEGGCRHQVVLASINKSGFTNNTQRTHEGLNKIRSSVLSLVVYKKKEMPVNHQ